MPGMFFTITYSCNRYDDNKDITIFFFFFFLGERNMKQRELYDNFMNDHLKNFFFRRSNNRIP